jgi:hypothetical protein
MPLDTPYGVIVGALHDSLPAGTVICFDGDFDVERQGDLLATVRSSRVSRARYTSPIPPAPIASRIS